MTVAATSALAASLAPASPARAAAAPGIVAGFTPVGLEELGGIALSNRRDTKYVVAETSLLHILTGLVDEYRILEIDGRRIHGYSTLYFDTAEMALFRAHHNAVPRRYKVRSRLYVESAQAFFEVKAKDGRQETIKTRTPTTKLVAALSSFEAEFVHSHAPYIAGDLLPVLENSFSRVTLARLEDEERVTLDFGLSFGANGERVALPGLAIVEVKQAQRSARSAMAEHLLQAGVHPRAFSKYCVGVSLLYPGIKHNRFNPELRLVERISGGIAHVG